MVNRFQVQKVDPESRFFLLLQKKSMLTQVLSFLSMLKENNNREWFNANKHQYEEAKAIVQSLVEKVIPSIARFDESVRFVTAQDCLFRIYRDVRFSGDKSPYKTNMGAWITSKGRKSAGPGYYIHIQPGESFLATGVYMPQPDQLKKIRQEIFYNVGEFKSILNEKSLKKLASGLDEMDKAKTPPRDFPKDFPDIDILKNRHYILSHPLEDATLSRADIHEYMAGVFGAFAPLNAFLAKALD